MDDDGDGDFTFTVAAPLAGGGIFPCGLCIVAPLYPVFGRPRSPPHRLAPELDSTATAWVPLPLGRLLLVNRGQAAHPPDGSPVETCYCSRCPGSPAAASQARARCRKSGSGGSAVFRWHQRLVGRIRSDGKEKFVFLSASPSERKGRSDGAEGGGIGGHAWSYYAKGVGGNGARRRSFLPYKQDLVGLFARATVFRRSYHPF